MPTIPQPVTNFKSLDYIEDLNNIHMKVDSCRINIGRLLENNGIKLEYDDIDRFYEELKAVLVEFALIVSALPPRTPRKLMATVSAIGKNPTAFLAHSESYDPEAKTRVLGACARSSPENNLAVQEFDCGNGDGPSPVEITKAANIVLEDLKKDSLKRSRGGRPKLDWQTSLAVDLADVFTRRGGKLTRIVGDGESGPFHRFLELILPSVKVFADRADFALTVTTMVAKARKALIPKTKETSAA